MNGGQTSSVADSALPGLPELLAPAGDWECARAAVENGADAIYFGLEKFNARMRARNFTEADLPKLMEYLHRRGVKGYVTFNTLVFENEIFQAEQYLRAMLAAGVDAVIVQDVGVCRLIRELSPDFPIHVSTQMTVTSARGMAFARELGCNLVVLARECSLKQIAKMVSGAEGRGAEGRGSRVVGRGAANEATPPSTLDTRPSALPIEVFIHGALCVAYSGQCLTSEALGGRSANRGECAQACRMPYDLIADGKQVPLGERKYLLSPQDLAGLEVLPDLVRAGVASLKIEGRLKSPEYVANITRIYREALDALALTTPDDEQGTSLLPRPATKERGEGWGEGLPDKTPLLSPALSSLLREERETGIAYLEIQAQGTPRERSSTPQTSNRLGTQVSEAELEAKNYEMQMSFSRGLYTGWFRGTNNQRLVHGRFGKKRGVFLGEILRTQGERVVLRLQGPLKAGDGVVFDAGHPEQAEEGGRVYTVVGRGEETWLGFGQGDIDLERIHVGDKLWKTSDPELERRLRQSFAGDAPKFQRPISLEVHGLAGQPLTLIARDELGHVVRLDSRMPLARAERQPFTPERLRGQLGRLGGTPFKLGELKNFLEGEVLLPVSELNRLRREAVQELEILRAKPKRWRCGPSSPGVATTKVPLGCAPAAARGGVPSEGWGGSETRPGPRLCEAQHVSRPDTARPNVRAWPILAAAGRRPAVRPSEPSAPNLDSALRAPQLTVLVRSLTQLEAALSCGIETLYCEFEDPKKYREAVNHFRNSALRTPHSALFVAPPRIFKMGEEWILKQVRSCEADGYLVRNYDHLEFFANDRRVGDYSLNIANRLAADYFKNHFGLERVTASYDLNFTQLEALLQAAPPEWFEVTIHQHMPMFHMEHCVFCAFLSKGTDYTNCGRPCDKHDVKLRDRVGAQHPLKADAGCRNTVFNALAQTGADYVSRMVALGARHFRLEFLNETPEQVTQTITKYRQLLEGKITGPQLWRELKLLNQLGVTRGQLGSA